MKKNIPIGQLLINSGYINQKQLDRALEVQRKMPDKKLGDILIDLDYVSEENMLKALSERLNSPLVDLKNYPISREATDLISESYARKNNVIPIDFEDNLLLVALNNPLNLYIIDEMKVLTGFEIKTMLSSNDDIKYAIDKYYSDSAVKSAVENINRTFINEYSESELSALGDRIEGTPTVAAVNTIIYQAVLKDASDIHIEPTKNNINVRIRINGDLINYSTMNIAAHNSVVSRLKILAGVNIAEKRLPQDGGFHFELGNVKADIRMSTLPTVHGEKIVLRLLSAGNKLPYTIRQIGLSEKNLEKIIKMSKIPNGIILTTGPTGSGKTTTLYAILGELIKSSVNIITVEDPVERIIDGINQVQINNKAGLTFANSLRSILRQDPDIIMIGEIRDAETAEIGVRASITGHLVLGSIHTNDSVSTIARLIDMGIEPYMVAASLSGIISQRLVKKLCPHCKEKYNLSESQRIFVGGAAETFYRPVGCNKCDYTGYLSRTGIYEVIEVDSTLREMISKKVGIHEIRNYAIKKGLKPLKDTIVEMALKGETSLEEVEKIIYSVE
ncbi:MAG: ATPase, T2SS/T4P/T4SS family [Tissierellia bacterium]|nr:ATPase, T2SS/T4P/T4SS family [Tissierellia bacterium]